MRKIFFYIVSIGILATSIPAISYRVIEAESILHVLNLFGYFTIQSNVAVLVLVIAALSGRRFSRRVELAVAVAITITAIIFQLFLRPWIEGTGVTVLVSNINHGSTTILYLLWFYLSERREELVFKDILFTIPYPAIYCVFGVLEGLIRKQARYFFLDLRSLGFLFLLWLVGLILLFLGVASLIILLDRRPDSIIEET